ncbi:MAG: AbrB family transcriptional regulator [Geminicoccaceae bacterium]
MATRTPKGKLRPVLLALVIGAFGSGVFAWADLPLPWLTGSMIATTAVTFTHLDVAIPSGLRTVMLAVLGTLLGSTFTTDTLGQAAGWLPTIALLPVYILVLGTVVWIYLRVVAGFDARTAFFSSTPGGLSEMTLLSDQYGGDMRLTSLVHGTRILLIVSTVPVLVLQFGVETGTKASEAVHQPVNLDLLLLGATGLVGYGVGRLMHGTSGALVGPMVISALAHMTGFVEGAPPFVIVALAQVVIGASIGSRFAAMPLGQVLAAIAHGLVLTLIMLVLAALFAAIALTLIDRSWLVLILTFMPGGVAEMGLVALALGTDPAFVSVHHLIRIALVVTCAPFAFTLYRRFVIPDEGAETGAETNP